MMTNKRFSNLPSVLAEYAPEVYARNKCDKPQDEKSPRVRKENKGKRTEAKKATQFDHGEHPTLAKSTPRSDRQLTPNTKLRKKQDDQEEERLEQVANLWDQVKAEYHLERQEVLEEKVRLQHKLIRAQDVRAKQIRERQERAEEKERTEKRRVKQEQAVALQSQGRSSADSKASSRRSKPKDDDPSSDSEAPSSPSTESSGQRKEKLRHSHHTGYLPSDSYAPAASPMKELLAEEEEEEEDKKPRAPDGVVTPADLNSVPWHHAQLYKMYGRHADYYIHPKMQPEKKKIVNPTLKSQKGHMGASHIWTTLRKDSMNKLHKTDRRFPQELKDTFSSHVREGITNHQKPVCRNFTVTEDVPDLNRLMDQSLLRRIRVLRHKTELMYRSSQTNNDRTKVLLFNSPLPAVNEGDEGIDKYLPSWDMSREEADSQLSYAKWLKKGEDAEAPYNDTADNTEISVGEEAAVKRERRLYPNSVLSPLGSEFSDSLHSIWDSVMMRQQPRQYPRYHFLTEAEAATPGAFLEKLGLNKDKLDLGRIDLLPEAQNLMTGRSSLPSMKALSAPQSRTSRYSVSGPMTAPADKSGYETKWQPLSLNALVEYKEQMATRGDGDFHQGRPTMWKAGLASASVE